MHMGHNIVPYACGVSHMHMGRPICVWANMFMGQNITIQSPYKLLQLYHS